MRISPHSAALLFFLLHGSMLVAVDPSSSIPNPMIRYDLFANSVREVGEIREKRRLSETDFLKQMGEPGVVVLDARSSEMFALRHLNGAVNLSLPDFSADALARIIPSKDTKVLIYCNNNFDNDTI